MQREINIPRSLNPQTIAGLAKQIDQLEKDNIRYAVLKGSADVFCEGLDIKWIANNDPSAFKNEILLFANALKKLQIGKFISIAVATGDISGGGLGLLCACDHVIIEDKTNFSLPEGLLGLVPGVIFPALLNKVSAQVVKKMFLSGQKYPASKALEWGVADDVVKKEDLQIALENAMSRMKSCKHNAIGDFKNLLYNSQFDRDKLSNDGMDLLVKKLLDPEIKERLISIAEFMED